MNILITGSSGLIGKSLQSLILDKINNYIFLTSNDCDLRNLEDVNNIFKNYKPDIVIHLASKVAGLYGNMNNNYIFLMDNIKINSNILECCEKYKIKRLINILSTCIFPNDNIKYPLTSDQILNGKPHNSNSGYAYSKRFLYIGSELLTNYSDIEIINLIPTNLYGKYDNYNLENSHVIPGLIHKIYLSKINNTELIIKGSGIAKRQFLYVDDLSKIILELMFKKLESKFYSLVISSPISDEITIKELINILCKKFNLINKIKYDISYSDGQLIKTSDCNELIQLLPNFKFTSLDNGLEKTINYFIENYNIIRK